MYWDSLGHYEAVSVGSWLYWVSRGHSCLYILKKMEIWTGVTDALRTHWQTLKDRASQLLIKYKSGAHVTQFEHPCLTQVVWHRAQPNITRPTEQDDVRSKVLRSAPYLIFVDCCNKGSQILYLIFVDCCNWIGRFYLIFCCRRPSSHTLPFHWSFLLGNFEMSETNVLLHQNEMFSKSEQMSTSYPRTRRSSCSPIWRMKQRKRKIYWNILLLLSDFR